MCRRGFGSASGCDFGDRSSPASTAVRSQDNAPGWSWSSGSAGNPVRVVRNPSGGDFKGSSNSALSFLVRSSAAERHFCGLEPVLIWTSRWIASDPAVPREK